MTRTRKIIYWIATVWLALGLFATGIAQLFGADGQGGADMMAKLGYPAYLMILLGFWKILAVVALLVPKFPLVKEWAYAGVVFLMTGAIYSHIAAHDPAVEILPGLLLLVLAVISWYLRPATRRMTTQASAT
ncbi:MAG TPA: DoxX family protein [Pyrinomonadaceae bacterium]|nr:DoxX family protein [Pyrinomonadaceae bacterium]